MIIEKDQKLLVLRIGEYKNYNFVKEHNSIIQERGLVWMLKLGKTIPQNALDGTIGKNGVVILREPKRAGGGLLLCKCIEYRNDDLLPSSLFPMYYKEMLSEYYWLSSFGTWLCLTSIVPLGEKYYDSLLLAKNDKPLSQVLSETRTSFMYVRNTAEILVSR